MTKKQKLLLTLNAKKDKALRNMKDYQSKGLASLASQEAIKYHAYLDVIEMIEDNAILNMAYYLEFCPKETFKEPCCEAQCNPCTGCIWEKK